MDLLRFQSNVLQQLKLSLEKPILVGVSGGADSLCLAEALFQGGFNLIIAHFDHQLRATSHQDAKFVEKFAYSRKLQFVMGSQNVRDYCQQHSLSIEEGARELRYQFLYEQARRVGAQAIATGHTADDQAETVLMHFLRGSGVSGLKGMKPWTILARFDTKIPLVRPLLQTSRKETEQFCDQKDIAFILDETNTDPGYFRNRLRLVLLPLLETYQPGIRERLGRTAQVLAGVEDLISELTVNALNHVTVISGPGHYVLSLSGLKAEPLAIQRELLRRVIYDIREDNRDVDFSAIERIILLIQNAQPGKKVDILDGLEAILSSEELTLKDKMVELIQPDQLWMPRGSSQVMREGEPGIHLGNFRIEFHKFAQVSGSDQILDFNDPFRAILDLDALQFPLILRTRQDGDRITPYGMGGHSMKLSDFWINEDLPKAARDTWPLLCDQIGICWIPGYRIMHPYRLKGGTKQILEIRVIRD